MHRQSLGSSPSSKLAVKDEHMSSEAPKHSPPAPSSSDSGYEDEEAKKSKRNYTLSMAPETYIHLIPMLILLCFLILYLSSHHPSPFDLADFPNKALSHPEAGIGPLLAGLLVVLFEYAKL